MSNQMRRCPDVEVSLIVAGFLAAPAFHSRAECVSREHVGAILLRWEVGLRQLSEAHLGFVGSLIRQPQQIACKPHV